MSPSVLLVAQVLAGFGCAVAATLLLFSPRSPLRLSWLRYQYDLDELSRLLILRLPGSRLARLQLLWTFALLAVWAASGKPVALAAAVGGLVVPPLYLRQCLKKRRERLEEQLSSCLLALANALKATAALGDALRTAAHVMTPPMSQELELVLHEMAMGAALDRAILQLAARIQKPLVSGALTALLVARQTGGDVPRVLTELAAAHRELIRLDGVVRQKTGEGRIQATVVAILGPCLVAGAEWMSPGLTRPLLETVTGNVILCACVAAWLVGVLLARKIAQVDI